MGLFNLFNFNSKNKNKDQNRDTATSEDKPKYNESLGQALGNVQKVLNEKTEAEAVTKQRTRAWISHQIGETSKFINQNEQLLEKAIFQEWAEKNNISPDVPYTRSFNLPLEQIRSLSKFAFEKCEELECQKLNISKENIFREWAEKNKISPGVTLEQLPKEDKENYWEYKYTQIENAKIQDNIRNRIRNRILKASKLINQDSQLLEKAIFQEWAEKNNISSDKSYESSYTNLSLDQFSSLEKYIFDKCEKLESQKLNNSKEKTLPEDEQKEQTQNEQQNTDNKVDSSIPTKNPIVPNKNNINEETTKIDLNEIYKELNTTEEELRLKWFNEVCEPIVRRGYGDCMNFEEWVIEYYNNYKDNLEKKPRSR